MTLSHQKVFDSPPPGSQPGTSQLDPPPSWDSWTFPPKFGEERANERAAQELRTAGGGGEGREEKRESDRGGGAWADARLSFGDVRIAP